MSAETDTSAQALLQRSLDPTDSGNDIAAIISSLTRDELTIALVDVLELVDDFVHCLAERNAISERAVLRSMGIEPDPRLRRRGPSRAGGACVSSKIT